MKKLVALLLAFAMVFAMAACTGGGGSSEGGETSGDVKRLVIADDE